MTQSAPEIPPVPFVGRSRSALLRRLIDVVSLPASRLAPQDRQMAGDVLLEMLFVADTEARRLCAERLAQKSEAPRRLLRYLAMCEFCIAEAVLSHNEGFDAVDLCEIVEATGVEHWLAVARRKVVPSMVTLALARTGEPHVIRTVLRNRQAEFSDAATQVMVEISRVHDDLCGLLIERLELRTGDAMAMFWWSDGETRRKILQRHAADRLELIAACGDVFAMASEENWADAVTRKTLQLIERRQRNRAAIEKSPYDSLEHAVEMAARTGMTPQLAQEIGYLSGVKPVTIAKMMSDSGGEGLAVLCKATGLKRPYLAMLWQALRRPVADADGCEHPLFMPVRHVYETLTTAKAQTTLRYWNWSLSSAFSPSAPRHAASNENDAEGTVHSTPQRTARLVFDA